MRMGFRVPMGALAAATLVGLVWAPAGAEDKPAPVVVHVGVNGLDKDSGEAIVKALKELESVGDAQSDGKRVMVQVKADKTLQLSDILSIIAAQSSVARKLEADKNGVALTGTVAVSVDGSGDDQAVIGALKGAPNVEKVEGQGGTYGITFKGSKGATIGDLDKALNTLHDPKAEEPPITVEDVAWTAPKGDGGGKHG